MSTSAFHTPGSWVAIAARDSWLLVEVPPDHELVARCWSLLSAGAGIDDVLDALIGGGIRTAPSFALARATFDDHRAVVRGSARVVLADGRELVAPPGRSWADDAIPDGMHFTLLSTDQVGGHPLPMSSGVTMANSVAVYIDAVDEPPVAHHAPSPYPAAPVDQPAYSPPSDPVVPRDPSPVPAPAAHERQYEQTQEPLDEPSAAPVPVPEPEPAASGGPSYDFIFEATQRPDDPVPQPAAEPTGEPEIRTDVPSGMVSPSETASWQTQPPDAVAEPAGGSGLIDALPWIAADHAPVEHTVDVPSPVPGPADQPDTFDDVPEADRTIDRATLSRLLGSAAAAPIVGPTVLAGYCPSRHLSPPNAAVCRVCGQPMPPQDSFEIGRPSLGVLRLSTGDTVVLDRPVVLGRSPEIPQDAEERPNAVRLASPENDISRTHASVSLDGWYVYVTDLGSTNGTVVTLDGQQPRRLRAHDPQLLEHGAQVSLADEVSFVFEVTG